MKARFEKGFTLVELLVATAMMGVLGLAAFNLYNFNKRETDRMTEDIQSAISRYGGAKVLIRDLAAAEPSFNFINLNDDNNLPFFVMARNELCRNTNCERKFTLELKPGANRSKSIFFILRKGYPDEMVKFTVDPVSTYSGKNYAGINWQYSLPDQTISKSSRSYSPWTKGRLLLLTSELDFFDCNNMTEKNDDSCNISCSPSGACNYTAKRQMKFLGVVNNAESELGVISLADKADLFNRSYVLCRPDSDLKCSSRVDISKGLTTAQTFFEKLPFIPGMDNRSYLSPVEIVEYYLLKPSASAPDHKISLIRTKYSTKSSGSIFRRTTGLVAGTPFPIMSGIASIQFRRSNISNGIIEYKIRKVNMRKSVK